MAALCVREKGSVGKAMAIRDYISNDKEFYKRIARIALPLCMQQILNNTMGIVDSAMVSQIGGVTAVGTANQISSLQGTITFGVTTGVGIYLTQYFGAKKEREQKQMFSLGLWMCAIPGAIALTLVYLFGPRLMGFYVKDPVVIEQAVIYLRIAALMYIPNALVTMFSFAYRSAQKTTVPFVIGTVGAVTNCLLNYLLIFGNFGFPRLGIAGAAIATVAATYLNLTLHVLYAKKTRQSFFGNIFSAREIPAGQMKAILARALPLVFNETLFSFGNTLYIKAFGELGTAALESYYVGSHVFQMFTFITFGVQNAMSSILGNTLGSNDIALAKKQGQYFVGISMVLSVVAVGGIYLFAQPVASLFSVSSPQAFADAVAIVRVFALKIALRMFISLVFSCLRAGGDSRYLVFLDCGLVWGVGIPLTFLCVYGFHMQSIARVFLIIQLEQVVRMVLGLHRYKTGAWLKNLTGAAEEKTKA